MSFGERAQLCHEAGRELEQIQFLPRFSPNDRTFPGMQTTLSQRSERSHRPRTGLIMSPQSIIPSRLTGTSPVMSSDRLSPVSESPTNHTSVQKCQRRNPGSRDASQIVYIHCEVRICYVRLRPQSRDPHSRQRLGQRPLTSNCTGFAVALMSGS